MYLNIPYFKNPLFTSTEVLFINYSLKSFLSSLHVFLGRQEHFGDS